MAMKISSHPHPEHWQTIRRGALLRDEGCRLCGSMKQLEVDHRTYERLGAETLLDVTTLCRACHELFTRAHRNTRKLLFAKRHGVVRPIGTPKLL